MELPVESALPALLSALKSRGTAVLQAPPGAGKTTRVPLFLLESGLYRGRILMLEPRRVAARAAAERLASELGEPLGGRVGYRIRGEKKTGKTTRIEVVTEGILTRILQNDPELSGIDCVIFDEFHERSLHADLGLALTLESREALRPDLHLLVMSATLDAAPVAKLMGDAPVVTSQGRAFPVETRWLDRPWKRPNQRARFEAALADLVVQAAAETTGGMLVFLPGAGEIRRVQGLLSGRLPDDCQIQPLFGGLPFAEQRKPLVPLGKGRKVVLATSIAETSLTIPDIRVVVDGGLARRARFDAGSGMSRLVTERATKAEATQRQGRAGRVAEGVCYRLWTKGEEGGMAPYPPAEIESTDLSALVLELANWGTDTPDGMGFLTPPPPRAYSEAQELLQKLGALDANRRITPHGKALSRLPLHPRLAHMLTLGGKRAATLAALLENRDPLRGGWDRPTDISLRIEALENSAKFASERPYSVDPAALKSIRQEAKRLFSLVPEGGKTLSAGALLSLAFPDRIGLRRKGEDARFLLSGGKGAVLEGGDALAGCRMIVAADLDGDTREARLRLGARLEEGEARALHPVTQLQVCEWSRRDRMVIARERSMLGALVLEDRHWKAAPPEAIAAAMVEGVRDLGLGALDWTKPARLLRARVEWLNGRGDSPLPDMSDKGLLDQLEVWLQPFLGECRKAADLKKVNIAKVLEMWLGWDGKQLLDRLAPASITAPTGTRLAVDYGGAQPSVQVRLQEMFGLTTHPTVGPDRLPVLIELLSPARRPVQTTADLPGFWASSYADVRKDMRGRYPRHPWPEDPTVAEATRRVKPKGR